MCLPRIKRRSGEALGAGERGGLPRNGTGLAGEGAGGLLDGQHRRRPRHGHRTISCPAVVSDGATNTLRTFVLVVNASLRLNLFRGSAAHPSGEDATELSVNVRRAGGINDLLKEGGQERPQHGRVDVDQR